MGDRHLCCNGREVDQPGAASPCPAFLTLALGETRMGRKNFSIQVSKKGVARTPLTLERLLSHPGELGNDSGAALIENPAKRRWASEK